MVTHGPIDMYPSENVANYFLRKSFDEKIPLNPQKLIKIVYLAHCWHRAYYKRSLVRDGIMAWEHGPIIPVLYYQLNETNNAVITDYLPNYAIIIDTDAKNLLDSVWKAYKDKTPIEVASICLEKDGPWEVTWKCYYPKWYKRLFSKKKFFEYRINSMLIQKFYEGKING